MANLVKDLPPEPAFLRPKSEAGKRLIIGIVMMQNGWDDWLEIAGYFQTCGIEPVRTPCEIILDEMIADLEKHRMVIFTDKTEEKYVSTSNQSTWKHRSVRRTFRGKASQAAGL